MCSAARLAPAPKMSPYVALGPLMGKSAPMVMSPAWAGAAANSAQATRLECRILFKGLNMLVSVFVRAGVGRRDAHSMGRASSYYLFWKSPNRPIPAFVFAEEGLVSGPAGRFGRLQENTNKCGYLSIHEAPLFQSEVEAAPRFL